MSEEIKTEQDGKYESEPTIDTSELPTVFVSLENREQIVERLLDLMGNPPDEMIVLARKYGEGFRFYKSGYRGVTELIGAMELMKQILFDEWNKG